MLPVFSSDMFSATMWIPFLDDPFSGKWNNVRVIRAAKPVRRRMTERGKVLNPEYSIFRDQPIAGASPLRINTLLYGEIGHWEQNFALDYL